MKLFNMLLDSGHEVTLLEGEELAQQEQDFTGHKHRGLVRLTPGRWLFPKKFTKYANDLYNFKWRSSDVVVMTYPKCGTTWTQEIIWTMRNNNNFDHPHANEPIMDRVPFIEVDMLFPDGLTHGSPTMTETPSFLRHCPDADPNDGVYLQMSAAIPDPRTIKTHLPFSLLHPSMLDTVKVVYVARNPKDVLLSFMHHSRLFFDLDFQGTVEDFYKYFISGDLIFGGYDEHVKEAWERRTHPNLHFVFYEDMQADIMKELRRLNDFLDTQLTEEQLKKVADYTSFESMKERGNEEMKKIFNQDVYKKDGGFFRKGKSGDWKKSLTPELAAEMDSWTAKHFNFGITFK
ncbi:sulfotransferase 1C4-like isoform X2 [Eriocheir sinensis]|uniref:sulfotransferase 1C4-like isoform X2 n=1 Tax=Eriocheir sinensis TaxID=95602 RepID=UPI0021C5DE10|nr:sulfotransferase 1C4-like isoform X2 [Eriocheir sinensis]